MKNFLLSIVSIAFTLTVFGQKNDKITHAGANGVFIDNIFQPERNNKAFINRREAGKTDWLKIGTFTVPASGGELLEKYKQYRNYAFDPSFLNTEHLGECWVTLDRTQSWDSLRAFLYDPVMMLALGRLYIDTTAVKGVMYEYQLTNSDSLGKVLKSVTTSPVQFPGIASYQKPVLDSKEIDQQSIKLTYYILRDHKPAYFRVMRKTGALGQWHESYPQRFISKKTQNADTLFMTLIDEQISPDEQYEYFIMPQDGYGNYSTNVSDTTTVLSYALKEVMLPQYFTTTSIDKEAALRLQWHVLNPQYIAAIELYRSNDYDDKNFSLVATLSPNDTSYIDNGLAPLTAYYYFLKIVDKQHKHTIRSAKVYGLMSDATPPPPPSQLSAEVAANGITLKWKVDGPFINGYYVYRSEGVDGVLKQISNLILFKDSLVTYIDTTSSLKSGYQYTYSVVQESSSHIQGKFSKPVYVTIIKNNDPLPVEIQLTAQRNGKSAQLFWEDLTLQNKTIINYQIFRKTKSDKDFVKLVSISSHLNFFVDSTLQQGNDYQYGLTCVDFNGKSGRMAQSNRIVYPAFTLPTANGIRAFIEKDNGIRLSWDKPQENNSLKGFNIYRYERESQPKLLGTVSASQIQYKDIAAIKGAFYFYYITCVGIDGKESEASIPVGVQN